MLNSRLYFLDGSNGRIRDFREFEAEDDAAAIDDAESGRMDGPMELWCRTRKVRNWEAILIRQSRMTA